MALHFQCSSNFLQYQILQQPLVNQSDFFCQFWQWFLAMLFTTRGFSPKQQYKVNVWCSTDSVKWLRTCHTNFTFAIRKKIIPWVEWNGLSWGKKVPFLPVFLPLSLPTHAYHYTSGQSTFLPRKSQDVDDSFPTSCAGLVCVCGQWVFNLRYWHDIQIPLKGLECLYFLWSECAYGWYTYFHLLCMHF